MLSLTSVMEGSRSSLSFALGFADELGAVLSPSSVIAAIWRRQVSAESLQLAAESFIDCSAVRLPEDHSDGSAVVLGCWVPRVSGARARCSRSASASGVGWCLAAVGTPPSAGVRRRLVSGRGPHPAAVAAAGRPLRTSVASLLRAATTLTARRQPGYAEYQWDVLDGTGM